jgi:hypothetical protein
MAAPALARAGTITFTSTAGQGGTTCPLTSFSSTGAATYCGISGGTPGADYLESQGFTVGQGQAARAEIDAPPGLLIDQITFNQVYAGNVNDGHQWGGGFYWPGGGCPVVSGSSQQWAIPSAANPAGTNCTGGFSAGGVAHVGVQLICGASGGCTDGASIYLPSFTVTATETAYPSLTAVGSGNLFYQHGWIRGGGWSAALSGADPTGVCSFAYLVNGSSGSSSSQPRRTDQWQQCPDWQWSPTVDTTDGQFVNGQNTLTVQDTDAAGNTSSASTTLNVDNQPVTVSLTPENDPDPAAYSGANHPVVVRVAAGAGPSGIASERCTDNGNPLTISPTGTVTVDGNGQHTVVCQAANNALDAGGAPATGSASLTVRIDEQTPTVAFSNAAPAPAWNGGQPTVVATGAEAQPESGISTVSCQATNRQTGQRAEDVSSGTATGLKLPGTGVWDVACTATTGAGSTGTGRETVQVDDATPTVTFAGASPAPATDTGAQTVTVTGAEQSAAPSGIAQTTCTIDGGAPHTAAGPSQNLSVTGNGSHRVTCTATTAAGVTGPAASETVTLSGYGAESTLRLSRAGARTRVICRARRRCRPIEPGARSRRACGRKRARCRSISLSTGVIALGWHQSATIRGVLIVAGRPAGRAELEVAQQPTGWPAEALPPVRTNAHGAFVYTVHGPSGRVVFTYPGSGEVSATQAAVRILARGASTIRVARDLRAGERARISGRVLGGHVPPDGVLVQLWWTATGDPLGWQPVRAPFHTDRSGRWQARMRPLTPGHVYWFQVRISTQSGWPWQATRSVVVRRYVA